MKEKNGIKVIILIYPVNFNVL